MAWEQELNGSMLEDLYVWIDTIPLSRPKKKIERDFSDGTLAAEVIRHYFPEMITMNNYVPNSSVSQKKINWMILNKKILSRFGMNVPETVIDDLSNGKSGTVERFLHNLRLKIDEQLELRQTKQFQSLSSPSQSLIELNLTSSINDDKSLLTKRTSRTSKSFGNLSSKWVSRLDYEELKQQCLQQQEEIEILQAKMRRLEHFIQLKDIQNNELSIALQDYRRAKPNVILGSRLKKK